ncbi:MAG: DUF1800 domain-containing protein [Robiginitomaculum sp.]|nr:DUF1800 domain-containing protein [Robiginitomaculum sp.]
MRFLNRATFGATQGDADTLTGTEVADWLRAEFAKQPTTYLQPILGQLSALPDGEMLFANALTNLFFDEVIAGNDQLRQRMVLALSEIIVASSNSDLEGLPATMAHYVDILSTNAFGNYRDLMEEITYSPAMSIYLTYLANQKGDMDSGRVPYENYARELLQLFTIGLSELNMDGTLKLDGAGQPIEIFDNSDITGLAKVFTGLSTQGSNFFNIFRDGSSTYKPLIVFPDFHSELEKSFLNVTIPPFTSGEESIDTALDTIFAHPNMAPFVSRQLIQRFVMSAPSPAYVERVATAFETGSFLLPDSTSVGTGIRGDLKATLSAVLLDQQALQNPTNGTPENGKIREPMLRFIHWARAFNETTPDAADERFLQDTSFALGQHPFRSPSVFNFFRPRYIAPGTATGTAGLTAPELQIVNESSLISNINFINSFIYNFSPNFSDDPNGGVVADYTEELALADDVPALIARLDLILTGNMLRQDSKDRIAQLLAEIPINVDTEATDRIFRVTIAISMVMSSPGYLVQR